MRRDRKRDSTKFGKPRAIMMPTRPATRGLPVFTRRPAAPTTPRTANIIRNWLRFIERPACSIFCCMSARLRFDFPSSSLRLSEICFFLEARSRLAARALGIGFDERLTPLVDAVFAAQQNKSDTPDSDCEPGGRSGTRLSSLLSIRSRALLSDESSAAARRSSSP